MTRRRSHPLVLVALLAAGTLLGVERAIAQDRPPVKGERAILALEAAERDAYRTLLEKVRGVQVDARTTVEDLVVEHSRVESQLRNFIRGARITEENFLPDGTAEVTVEVELELLERLLGRELTDQRQKTLSATGYGAPPPPEGDSLQHEEGADPVDAEVRPLGPEEPPQSDRAAPDSTVRVTGEGVPPDDPEMEEAQRRLQAELAARQDAYRRLLERVYGLRIDARTTVRDMAVASDVVQSRLRAFVRGARIVEERIGEDGVARVTLELDLSDLESVVRSAQSEGGGS